MTTKARITDRYDRANLEAARIVAANPVAYPPGSLMAQWAAMVLSRATDAQDGKARPLSKGPAGPVVFSKSTNP